MLSLIPEYATGSAVQLTDLRIVAIAEESQARHDNVQYTARAANLGLFQIIAIDVGWGDFLRVNLRVTLYVFGSVFHGGRANAICFLALTARGAVRS